MRTRARKRRMADCHSHILFNPIESVLLNDRPFGGRAFSSGEVLLLSRSPFRSLQRINLLLLHGLPFLYMR
jgi:hypothetical protein